MEVFGTLSSEARESLLEVISRPTEIVRSLSVEEVYFTVKQVGEENAPALIACTTGKQLQYILDLELWNKEEFSMSGAAKWLEFINGVSQEKIMQFVQVSDPELLVTILHDFVHVVGRNPDIDLTEQSDSLPNYTIDDLFYIEFKDRASEPVIRNLIETIYTWSAGYYFSIMEELSLGRHTENQELAAKWRALACPSRGFRIWTTRCTYTNTFIPTRSQIPKNRRTHPPTGLRRVDSSSGLPVKGYSDGKPFQAMSE